VTAVVFAEVDTTIVAEAFAVEGLMAPDTATESESPALMDFGTLKTTVAFELVSVGVAVTVPEPLECVLSVIT
jgi:hypothetical protein